MLKIVRLIRNIHSNTIIIVDDYECYYIYDNDTYIISYLTNLSIKMTENSMFVRNKINYLNYLLKILRNNSINCIVVSKIQGYNIEYECIFDNNNYQKFMKKGRLVYKRKKEIIKLMNRLKLDMLSNKNKINDIKDLIINYV